MKIKLVLLLIVAAAGSAQATNGVFEINASCVQFGCFAGDGPGLPVQIENPGSYRLTGNLSTSDLNTDLIEVNADNVSIDLNGFSLLGPVTCSGISLSCSASGAGDGIDARSADNVTIRNGVITGMGDDGIGVASSAFLEELTIAENAGNGVNALGAGALLRRLRVRENGGSGVNQGFNSNYIMDSNVLNNGNRGVFGGFCSNVLMSGNDNGNSCQAVGPSRCDTPSGCD